MVLADKIEVDLATVLATAARGSLRLRLLGPEESLPEARDRGHFWLQTLLQLSCEIGAKKESGRTVHFYGHKGG